MAAPTTDGDSKESAGSANANTAPQSTGASDPVAFYGYLFEKDKTPTRTLDAFLRALAKHIITDVGDKRVHALTPRKLAAFYRAVGGDYDSLFKDVPYRSISYVWQVTGCQHSLEPIAGRDFEPPSVPALTLRGFVRWESIEILLGPEEHVPFMQFAAKNWALKHPETGEPFPTDLPQTAFPREPDADVDKWHKQCAEKLRKEATPKADHGTFRHPAGEHSSPYGSEREEHKPRVSYAHVRNPYPDPSLRPRNPPDYFARPVQFAHGRGRVPSHLHPRSPDRERHRPGSSSDERHRRRSFSDYPSPPTEPGHPPIHVDRPTGPPRRNSHPRVLSSSDSPSDSEGPSKSPRSRQRPRLHVEEPRRTPPPAAPHPPPAVPGHAHRDGRNDDSRKRSAFPIPDVIRDQIDKVTSFVSNGRSPDRHGSASGRRGEREQHLARRSREQMTNSHLSRSWSDLESDHSAASDSSTERRRRLRLRREREARLRERERELERGRDRAREEERERERDPDRNEDLEVRKRRERYANRPDMHRRTSSHADVDRYKDEIWDPRERDRDFRDERRRWKERNGAPVTGVGGRRYPPEPGWS